MAPSLVKRIQTVAQAKKAFADAEREAKEPSLATQLGYLKLLKRITPTQFTAGWKWAELCGQHDRVMGFPRRHTASPNYDSGFSGGGHQPGSDLEARHIQKVREQYAAAHAALLAEGITAIRTVNAVCIEERCLDWDRHEWFEHGLDALAVHFRLSKG